MKRFALFFVIFVLSGAFCFAQTDLQQVAAVYLAKTENVSVIEFKDYVNLTSFLQYQRPIQAAEWKELPSQARIELLTAMTDQRLICQAAEKDKVSVTDKEINDAYNEQLKPLVDYLTQKNSRAPSDKEIGDEFLKRTGVSRSVFKDQLRRSAIAQRYLSVKKEAIFRAVTSPSDGEIQNLYNSRKDKTIFEQGFIRPDTIRIRMLVVPAQGNADKTAAQTRANNLARQIGGDAGKFDEAVTDSRKEGAGYVVGEGYLYKHDQIRKTMGADFVDAAFKLKQGEVSKVLNGPDGFYIIKVTETYREKLLGLNDAFLLDNPRVTVKMYITQMESQGRQMEAIERAYKELMDELKKRGNVKLNETVLNSIVW